MPDAANEKGSLPSGCYRAIFFILVVPITLICTWLMPVTWISLERSEALVTATVRPTILLVVPIGSVRVVDLREVTTNVEEGTFGYRGDPRPGTRIDRKWAQDEDTATLTLIGSQGQHEFPVSPASVGSLEKRIESFLEQGSRQRRRILVAPEVWKVSLFFIPFAVMILGTALRILIWPLMRVWTRGKSRDATAKT